MNKNQIKEVISNLKQLNYDFIPNFNSLKNSSEQPSLTVSDNGDISYYRLPEEATAFQPTPKIISFYTDDKNYTECSKRFLKSLNELRIENFYIEKIPSNGNWESNCNYKSEFIKKCLLNFKEPVLWIDIDATLEQLPQIPNNVDFAIHLWDGWEFASGTAFFNYTERAMELVNYWDELGKIKPLLWDQMLLDEAWNHISKYNSLITYWLSEKYIHIFDVSTDLFPVVKHFQESRNMKKLKKPSVETGLIDNRKKRKPSDLFFDLDADLIKESIYSNKNINLNYKELLKFLLKIRDSKSFKFIQVGAMDGKKFDPIFEHINESNNVNGVLLEPNNEMFKQLINNYKNKDGLTFINSAIDKEDGTRILYRIPKEYVESGVIPDWALGISSFYNDRNAIGGKKVDSKMFDLIKSIRIEDEVTCISFSTLLKNKNFDHIDLLQIDTEGHDWNVLSTFPIQRIKPLIINFEYYNLPNNEQKLALQWLKDNGYFWSKDHKDVTATLLRLKKDD